MAFIVKPSQIFLQNFCRNVPCMVLYQADDFAAQSWFFIGCRGNQNAKK